MPLTEYEPGTTFPGVIGRTTDESSPAWPRPLRADAGSPNVLMIVLDDVGYGQPGCYGSPIATPNLDALGLQPPAAIRGVTQSPLHGVSFTHSFDDAGAPTRHRIQYFEMFGHRAIDHDGWRAVCLWPGPSFAEAGKPFGALISAETLTSLDAGHWELYHVAEDPAENHNLAEQHRDKLIELIAMWYAEAGKYGVFPIDGSATERMMAERPQVAEQRAQYVYRPHTQTLPFWVGPRVLNRPHSITADAEIPDSGADGVLICPTPIAFNPGGLTCGANPGSAIVGDYQAPFPFTGTLHTVTIDLSGELITDTESEIRMAMARQ
jgi:hypothetical protein